MPIDYERLESPLRKLRKILKKLPKQPQPELVHDLRTRTRRIEAALKAFKLTSNSDGQRLAKALKPLRRKAGKVRDMDVLTSFASSLHQTNEKECLIQLLEFLGSKRHRQSRKLNRFVNKHKPGIQRRVKRFSSLMQKDLHRPGKQSEWPADAMALAIELSTELGKWPRLNATNLHAFRLKVKELRYVLQMASNPDAAFVASLGEVKDAIGEWHDWQVLEMIGKKILSHGRGCNLLKSIHHERMQKFDHALSLANHMRRRYLPEGHGNQHGRLRRRSARLNGPALAATSSLAA